MRKFLINKKLCKQIDFVMLLTSIAITFFGSMNIYSATNMKHGFYYFKLQLLWIILGLVVLYLILTIDYNIIGSYCNIIYWISISVLIFNDITSRSIKGASSWIRIGNVSIEPGEFVKIAMILLLAKKSEKMEGNINNPKNFFILVFYALIPIILIAIQPNIGMVLICFFIVLGMFYIEGLNIKVILGGFAAFIPFTILIWFSGILKPYQKYRIIAFIDPSEYQQSASFQLTQSVIGIGSGGIFGNGFLKGSLVSNGLIPEVHTDFIFAVVGEEWGFIGAAFLIIAYVILIYRIIKIAKLAKDLCGRLICIGIASSFLFSIFENIGMTIGIMPIAGITLPFMSYGGSSILTNFISLGLVLNVGMRRKKINF